MYLTHFGLERKPFSLALDTTRYYPAAHHEAMSDLRYSIEQRQGLASLVGDPGTGKTTLLKELVKTFDSSLRCVLVLDASLASGSLLKRLTAELGLPIPDPEMVSTVLRAYLQNWLLLGKSLVLLVDEAQALTGEQLEELRHLTNLEVRGKKLLEIVLAGQPALETRLSVPRFEALRQRIAVRTYVSPLSLEHTGAYIRWRLETAGARESALFDERALESTHRRSGGIPRIINLICDRALLIAYADNVRSVSSEVVEAAADELGIHEGSSMATREGSAGSPQELVSAAPPWDASELEGRLERIEQKLDSLIDAVRESGKKRKKRRKRRKQPEGESARGAGEHQLAELSVPSVPQALSDLKVE